MTRRRVTTSERSSRPARRSRATARATRARMPIAEVSDMAEFQAWDRQLLPQGGLVAPQTGPSLAESFGQGVADLATATSGAIESMQKTDEWHAEKQWEIDQPKAAALVNKLQLQIA